MRINERSNEELVAALAAVETALAEKATKSTVLKVLADRGWCSPKSAGIEKTFLSTLKDKGISVTGKFAEVMGETGVGPVAEPAKPETTANVPVAEPAQAPVSSSAIAEQAYQKAEAVVEPPVQATVEAAAPTALPPEGPGDFTVVNLKAVSLMQTRNERTDVRFIGSEDGLNGNVAVSVLRSSCNLIEFAI